MNAETKYNDVIYDWRNYSPIQFSLSNADSASRNFDPYWTGGLKGGRVAVGFLPLPAVINILGGM